MHRFTATHTAALLVATLVSAAVLCCGRADIYRWAGTGAGTDGGLGSGPDWASLYEAVDILIVVDDSDSMDEEQVILGTSQFNLINGLVNPLATSGLAAGLDDLRVAVVSTNMGFSWGGNPYEPGDGWPTDPPPECMGIGDDGKFKSYQTPKQIKVEDDVIACDTSNSQCPFGWLCWNFDPDGVGACSAPGDDSIVDCPALGDDWAETPTPADLPNPFLATQVACLTGLGTQGCGFEQHLQAGSTALTRDDQLGFVRDEALLAVIVVSDEDDCSIASNTLFAEPEIQDLPQLKINIACGEHPEHLYPLAGYREAFLDIKGGNPDAVLFAVVGGVPPVGACQGWGDAIQGCLDHDQMQLTYEIVDDPLGDLWYYEPACTRHDGDVEVTRAVPARRLVELALDFGSRGYVYSICNDDWSPAMNDLAAKIPLKGD
jgi:hypothetical protein